MPERRRQSKAFSALGDEAFGEYRRLCLPRDYEGAEWTLERIVEWLAGQGVAGSISSVKRDADHFRAVAVSVERMSLAVRAAGKIVEEVQAEGGVANLQAAAVNVFTQQVLDFLVRPDSGITEENVGAMSKLGATLSRLTGSEIARSQADALRKKFDAEMARAAAAGGDKGLTADRIAEVRKAVFGG